MPACALRRAQRKPQPLGANSHLWQLPAYQSTPSEGMSSAIWPGACAPSTSTFAPRARASCGEALHRENQPGGRGDVVQHHSFVRAANVFLEWVEKQFLALTTGRSIRASTDFAPVRRQTSRIVWRTAL